jgi:hypothetical protein
MNADTGRLDSIQNKLSSIESTLNSLQPTPSQPRPPPFSEAPLGLGSMPPQQLSQLRSMPPQQLSQLGSMPPQQLSQIPLNQSEAKREEFFLKYPEIADKSYLFRKPQLSNFLNTYFIDNPNATSEEAYRDVIQYLTTHNIPIPASQPPPSQPTPPSQPRRPSQLTPQQIAILQQLSQAHPELQNSSLIPPNLSSTFQDFLINYINQNPTVTVDQLYQAILAWLRANNIPPPTPPTPPTPTQPPPPQQQIAIIQQFVSQYPEIMNTISTNTNLQQKSNDMLTSFFSQNPNGNVTDLYNFVISWLTSNNVAIPPHATEGFTNPTKKSSSLLPLEYAPFV